jgi:hypothetical protein
MQQTSIRRWRESGARLAAKIRPALNGRQSAIRALAKGYRTNPTRKGLQPIENIVIPLYRHRRDRWVGPVRAILLINRWGA